MGQPPPPSTPSPPSLSHSLSHSFSPSLSHSLPPFRFRGYCKFAMLRTLETGQLEGAPGHLASIPGVPTGQVHLDDGLVSWSVGREDGLVENMYINQSIRSSHAWRAPGRHS